MFLLMSCLLMGHSVFAESSPQEIFIEAIKSNDKKSVAEYIDMVDVDATDEEGLASLHYAAKEGNLRFMQLLVDHGADINIKSHAIGEEGHTPLHYVAAIGDAKGAQCLIDLGANIKPVCTGHTPFSNAYRNGHIEVCELLKKHGAYDLLEATFCANLEDIKDFLKNGDANYSDPLGRTALHLAAMDGNNEIIEILINHGANINAINSDGMPPIFFATTRNLVSTIKLMVKHGATLSFRCEEGYSPLHFAASCGYLETVKVLIEFGVSLNSVNDDGSTPLDLAVAGYRLPGNQYRDPDHEMNYRGVIDFLRSCK